MNHTVPLAPDAYDFQIRELGLLDTAADSAYDNLTRLAARVLATPCALVTIVRRGQDDVTVKSSIGLTPEAMDRCRAPLSRFFCQYVQATDAAVRICDTRQTDLLPEAVAPGDQPVGAYLGAPIHLPDGTPIGAFCVIDISPRDWSEADLETVRQMALCMDQQIAHKQALRHAVTAEALAQQEAEARKSFLAHMSHEIRTPLNGIIGSVDLLMRGTNRRTLPLTEQNELLRTVNRSAQNLQRLLNDALDIAKIDAGKLELAPEPFDLHALADDVAKLFSANAAAKGVELCHKFSDLPAGELRLGDGFRLSQILGNLLSNAVKFTDVGSVCMAMRGTPLGVQIEVRDSGCGIEPDRMEHLFKPFTQADATTARTKGGTGLGMAIVHQMVELMGGRMRVESSPGVGTSFHLFLPMPVTQARADDLQAATERPHQLLRGKRILVADDSPANRLVLQRMLEQLGATVDKAQDGIEAFGLATATAYDVLMLDIQMPGFNGMELAEKLRTRHQARSPEAAERTLYVAVTANAFAEQVESYLEAGFDGWLAKPLRQSDLLRVLSPLIAAAAIAPAASATPVAPVAPVARNEV
ncbi:ATP-binding protein [Tritonibacter horizontis]|uniref:histidine kinase n=1 Tax=Tritonibacter horizontis TaxID=1768241 RepID=A0A132BWL1_9RHOB|nr:ATP-binding protein [Tritonibacter horizontis]KUP92761.1 autoinducer 2 sensor kinase/phosphatase LuxQ [Tritonibacter horizontis]